MKTFKSVFIILLMIVFGAVNLPAKGRFKPSLGLAAKTSTNGFGGDAVYNFNKRMSVRVGFEQLGLVSDYNFKEGTVDYVSKVHYKTGSISLLYDYYLANHLFVTAGAGWNLFNTVIEGGAANSMQYGDIQIPKEAIGTFDFEATPSIHVSPYLGIGFGRTLGLNKKVGFAVELGGFYQGAPQLNLSSTGLLSPTSNPDQQIREKLESQIKRYTIYPVLKFSLSYKITSFK